MRRSSLAAMLVVGALWVPQVLAQDAAAENAPAAAAVKPGEIGAPAAELEIAEWVKGGPITLKEGRGQKVYVVEFWATWCPPCRTSIPHLTDVQKKFKDKNVVVIGITDEELDTVKPFVEKMGERMDYVVAIDKNDAMQKAYMEAYGQNGIPHAFIVNQDGVVIWTGHPMDKLDEVLQRVVDGKYTVADARDEARKAAELAKRRQALFEKGNEYIEALTGEGGIEKARPIGDEFLKLARDDHEVLNEFTWYLLTAPMFKERDYDFLVRAGKAAVDASGGESASVLDTYARALYDSGRKAEAIKVQKQAIELSKVDEQTKQLEETLKRYESGGAPPKPDGE
jgi:thiol-disulfide isomerase/thioredoxin